MRSWREEQCFNLFNAISDNGIFLRLTAELAEKYALIVIFVCICVGVGGILAGVYILGVKVWVFHLGLGFLGSYFVLCIASCYYILGWRVCLFVLFWFFLLFVDVFKSAMSSNLPPEDHHLGVMADSLLDVTLAGRASSTTTQPCFQRISSPHSKGSEGRKTLVQAAHVFW